MPRATRNAALLTFEKQHHRKQDSGEQALSSLRDAGERFFLSLTA